PVVGHADALAVLVELDLDLARVAVDDLVDRVVEDLPQQVVQALLADAADVHAGALADVVDALEELDRRRAVLCVLGHAVRPSYAFLPAFFALSASAASRSGSVGSGMITRLTAPRFHSSVPLPPRAVGLTAPWLIFIDPP